MIKIPWKMILFALFLAITGFIVPFTYNNMSSNNNSSLILLDDSLYLSAGMQSDIYPFRNWKEKEPEINGEVALISNIDTSYIFYQKNINLRRPIASVSKLMTSLVSRNYISSETEILIQPEFLNIQGDRITNLKEGEKIKAIDLEKMMLLSSSNKSALALESVLPEDKFIEQMNGTAKFLNMNFTNFEEPTGLSMANQSTANDLKKLIEYILKNKPEILTITQEKETKIISQYKDKEISHSVKNVNLLSQSPVFLEELNIKYLGGKTGYTDEAKQTYTGIFSIPSKKKIGKDIRVLIVLLYSNDRYQDIEKLLRWLNRAYIF
jgi:D-alanyl-D-alanine carboxypeptidase